MKTCRDCGRELPLSEFHKDASHKDGAGCYCKACGCEHAKRRRSENPELFYQQRREYRQRNHEQISASRRARWLAQSYGLTIEQYDAMHAEQRGCCAICGERPDRLVVDHCHDTGAARGLLCDNCNMGLGKLGDNPAGLRRALRYLLDAQRHQQTALPLEDAA